MHIVPFDTGHTHSPAMSVSTYILKISNIIQQIKDEFPHLVHGNVAFARKMGFPEVIFSGDVRNDLYLTLVNGEFSKGSSKGSDNNIEVTVVVCDEKGDIVPNIMTLGAGAVMLNEYKSVIYHHDDKPKWNETFKVQLSIEEFKNCHLRFTFKRRSSNESKDRQEKPFGLSYVRLMQDNGTTLQHKCHQLIVYRIDHKKYDKDTQLSYLELPSRIVELTNNAEPAAGGLSISPKDSFTVETNLCSTKLTQDGECSHSFIRLSALLQLSICSRFAGSSQLVVAQGNAGRIVDIAPQRQSRRGCEISARHSGCTFQHSSTK